MTKSHQSPEWIVSISTCSYSGSFFFGWSLFDFLFFGLCRSFSLSFGCFFKFSSDTDSDFRWAFSCLSEVASYHMNSYHMDQIEKVGSPLSPDLSSWSSKWNNFPYTSNLNVWRVLFMTNHFVTFQEILNFQSAETSLAISWKPLESYGKILTCGVSRRYHFQIHRTFLM